jgi:hypothetical protein
MLPAMQMVIRLVLCFVSLAAFAAAVRAQEPAATPPAATPPAATPPAATPPAATPPAAAPGDDIDWPSPDGKFAFMISHGEDGRAIDLIDRTSGKKLRIGEEESSQTSWHVLWASDSNRFALMTRYSHPIQEVEVYFRSSETFQKTELPKLPDADIPEKLKHGKKFPHVAGLNWQEATEWKKDGSLVVTIDTMIDGAGSTITATRTVVLGFDPAGTAKIVKSTIKYKTETDR